jgi:hypothetical protein
VKVNLTNLWGGVEFTLSIQTSWRNTMTKKDKFFACLLIAVMLTLQIVPVFAQGGNAQVWGQRYRSGGYWGVDTIQTTPNPSIPSGSWTGGPNGISDLSSTFIESGPTKACDYDCGLHPYGSWGSATDGVEFVDLTVWLGAGLKYRYRTNYIGNNQWQSVFCSGGSCRGMITGNLGTNTLPYVASGGESSGPQWGSITTTNAKYKPYNTTTWYSWCYTSKWINVTGGTVSACNTTNYSWKSSY